LGVPDLFGEPIRSIQGVRDLSAADASLNPPVELQGQVTFLGKGGLSFFLTDGETSIFVSVHKIKSPIEVRIGSKVSIAGYAVPGGFLPHIESKRVEILGDGDVPEPMDLRDAQLFEPDLDCSLVRLQGILLKITKYDSRPFVFLTLTSGSRELLIRLAEEEGDEKKLEDLMHQRIEVVGIAATQANAHRQITDRYFQVDRFDRLKVLYPKRHEIQPIGQVLKKGAPGSGLASLRGRVIHQQGRELYLRMERGCFLVRLPFEDSFEIGNEVAAEGYLLMKSFGPELLAYRAELTGVKGEIKPRPFPVEDKDYSSLFNNELVELRCELVSVGQTTDVTRLYCLASGVSFEVEVPRELGLPESVLPGCELLLSGICFLECREPIPSTYLGAAELFKIRVRDIGDLKVVKGAPWWTIEKLLVGIGVIGVVGFFAILWGIMLRKQVKLQTKIIGEQTKREAVHEERQRLARELHDSLQQNLMGISIQVDNAQAQKDDSVKRDEVLDRVHQMISECQEETRESITRLRSSSDSRKSFLGYLEGSLRERAEAAGVELDFTATGTPMELDSFVVRHSMNICQEAFTNALKHAEPKKIAIMLAYRGDELEVTIKDDGKGFDLNETPLSGHYGIIGMRERAEILGAEIDIQTVPGQGTEVNFVIPSSQRNSSNIC